MNYEGPLLALATFENQVSASPRKDPARNPAPVNHGHITQRCGNCSPEESPWKCPYGLGQLDWEVADGRTCLMFEMYLWLFSVKRWFCNLRHHKTECDIGFWIMVVWVNAQRKLSWTLDEEKEENGKNEAEEIHSPPSFCLCQEHHYRITLQHATTYCVWCICCRRTVIYLLHL